MSVWERQKWQGGNRIKTKTVISIEAEGAELVEMTAFLGGFAAPRAPRMKSWKRRWKAAKERKERIERILETTPRSPSR